MKKVALAFAAILLCSCSMMDFYGMTPAFTTSNILYSGQSCKITRLSSNCNYEWISSDPSVLKVVVNQSDSVATLVCDLGGVSVKSVTEMTGPAEAETVVLTAINKLHTEYTYEMKVTVKPWYLGFMDQNGKEVSSCKVGDKLTVAMFDLETSSAISYIDDGRALSKEHVLYLDFGESDEHMSIDSTTDFSAEVTALAPSTLHSVTATFVNDCEFDADRVVSASISITE